MSIGDFIRLFSGRSISARLAAAAIAACAACVCASEGKAAANGSAPFAVPFLPPGFSTAIDDAAPASFASRFDCRQISLIRDIRDMFDIPMYRASLEPPKESLKAAKAPRRQKMIAAAPAIVGTASMYNPNDASDQDSGGSETASGEQYDAEGWTAAIRTDLRAKFGGVGYGKNYQPVFVLVQSDDKQAIVRINDVGKLKRGRIIDLNQRAMRFFDPTLQLGVVERISVTPLAGRDWALGPVNDDSPVSVASADRQAR
jgi:rare lipoprotein A